MKGNFQYHYLAFKIIPF